MGSETSLMSACYIFVTFVTFILFSLNNPVHNTHLVELEKDGMMRATGDFAVQSVVPECAQQLIKATLTLGKIMMKKIIGGFITIKESVTEMAE